MDESLMKRLFYGMLGLLLSAGPVLGAAGDGHDAQINAAASDAVARLRADIEIEPISPDLSVADFVHRIGTDDELEQTLRRADQIGGPRWIDDETCQVKMTIGSDRLRPMLVKMAEDNPHVSPLPPDALRAKLRVWDDRTFTATGTSISASRAEQLRPADFPGPWRGISDDARKQAIVAARDNVIDRLFDSIGAVEITPGSLVSQMLGDKHVRDDLRQWLATRPVTRLEFRNDLTVQMTLAVDPHDFFDELCHVGGKTDLLPKDPTALAKLRREIHRQMSPAIGTASVNLPQKPEPAVAANPIPDQPPQWIAHTLNTEASESFKGSRLKTTRLAENNAMDLLRGKIDKLELSSTTIGEAAKQSPAVERAVEQAMGRAHAYKIEYLPDGSASVKVSLDPRDLWESLREIP
jgi:hypothetical protein